MWQVQTPQGPAALKLVAPATSFEEARAVAALDHPGIVRIYDYGITEGPAPLGYLLFELADGTWRDRPTPSFEALRDDLTQLLTALAHAHARGILHLDLKPSNLLLCGERLVLADFGIAYRVGTVGDDRLRGSTAWMAPEQFWGDWRDVGPTTDVYAVGLMAWERLAGRLAQLESDTVALAARRVAGPPAPPPGLDWPTELHDWFRRVLSADVGERFPDAASALRAFGALEVPLGVGQPAYAPDDTTMSGPLRVRTTTPEGEDAPLPLPPWVPWASLNVAQVLADPPRADADPRLSPWLHGLLDVGLVGRQAHREALAGALTEVVATREPRLVALVGPAGTGKSRLARWCCERAAELGAAEVLAVRAEPDHDGFLQALAVRWSAGGLSEQGASQQLAKHIDDDELCRVLGRRIADPTVGMSDRRGWWTRALQAVTCRRPAVLWIDDGHADPHAWAFARQIARSRLPLLVMVTLRADLLDAAQRRELDALQPHEVLEVGPMSPLNHQALLQRLLLLDGALVRGAAARAARRGHPHRRARARAGLRARDGPRGPAAACRGPGRGPGSSPCVCRGRARPRAPWRAPARVW